ncbi:MAG: IS1595 family transposase [Thermoleophilaceae bacterium]
MKNGPAYETKGQMNLVKLVEDFGSEDKCRAFLRDLRWPDGVRCPRCDSDSVSVIADRNQWDCNGCRYQFSVTAGTLFHDSHLPLWKWFLAIYLVCESKKGISANQLKRTLAVSYKTAWYLCHRIRAAMGDDDAPLLKGIVEADETYVGGKATGFADRREAARGRRLNKSVVLGAIERGGELRTRVVDDASRKTIHAFLKENVADEAKAIYTDSFRSYRGIADADTRHEWVNHSADEWVRGDVHTNTVESAWSLFERAVMGSYHRLSKKHLQAYLDEFTFRFNNRENPFLFRDTLLALLVDEPLPYKKLVHG